MIDHNVISHNLSASQNEVLSKLTALPNARIAGVRVETLYYPSGSRHTEVVISGGGDWNGSLCDSCQSYSGSGYIDARFTWVSGEFREARINRRVHRSIKAALCDIASQVVDIEGRQSGRLLTHPFTSEILAQS